jgi:phosphoribosylaminoimidazole-succinocarboxamide synthase
MPDTIDDKGKALCLMGSYCFEELQEIGLKTHYRGLVTQNGKISTFEELEQPTNIMEFNLVNIIKPRPYKENEKLKYDYSDFNSNLKNFLIPLEIIYRNGLPEGSSVFKRLKQGLTTLEELGLKNYPKPGDHLASPIFDISTKLEEEDRYISWQEAQKIAGLTDEEVKKIRNLLSKVNEIINSVASKANLRNEDGKIEVAFDNKRQLMLVDVVGTLDECRFTFDGIHVSKEVARQFYKNNYWYKDVEDAKKQAKMNGIKNWRSLCKSVPSKLDPQLKDIIGEIYKAATNELTNRIFFDSPNLEEVIKKYKDYIKSTH